MNQMAKMMPTMASKPLTHHNPMPVATNPPTKIKTSAHDTKPPVLTYSLAASTEHVNPPIHNNKNAQHTSPPENYPTLAAILSQQNQMIAKNTSIIYALTFVVNSLHTNVTQHTVKANRVIATQMSARELKGQTSSTFPKFGPTNDDNIIRWYNNVIWIISLSK